MLFSQNNFLFYKAKSDRPHDVILLPAIWCLTFEETPPYVMVSAFFYKNKVSLKDKIALHVPTFTYETRWLLHLFAPRHASFLK